jgi:predicted exporter
MSLDERRGDDAGSTTAPRSRAFTLVLFALALAAGIVVILRTHFSADLSAFLPSAPDAQQRLLIDQLKQGAASRTLMLGINGGDADARARASRDLAAVLRARIEFSSVNNGERGDYAAAGERLIANRYVLSRAVEPARFEVEGLRAALADTALRLATPEGATFKPLWPRDPTGEMLVVAESLIPAQSPRIDRGVWVSRDGQRALLLLTLRDATDDIDAQTRIVTGIETGFAELRRKQPALEPLALEVTGHAVFAIQSRELIEREAKRLALFGAVGVALILLLAFGRLSALAIATVPVASGVVAGIAATSLVFGQVHGMTLGFGATLIGESVDYAIYYLIQARPDMQGRSRWWADGWPTVRLGLFTSLIGFAALALSGFPGLAQLGVFSLAGLIAAALVTRWVLPVLAPQGTPGVGARRILARWTQAFVRVLPRLRWPFVALTLIGLALLAVWPRAIWRGDLQSLSPVPARTIEIDTRLRADLGASDARTLVVAQGVTLDAALAAAEAASAKLDALVDEGLLAGYESPARLLPSAATQTARRAALPDGAALKQRIAEAASGLPFKPDAIAPFIDEVQAARARPLLAAADYAGTALAVALESMLLRRADGTWAALLPLQLPEAGANGKAYEDPAPRLREALAPLPAVAVLDIKQSIDDIYAHYMREALWQSALGALAVVALLAWALRSRHRLARVVLPLAMAVVLTLALLVVLERPLGVLHLVGLLLVVAVGSNYALFFDHLRHTGQDDDDTMASLALANLTTVLSFGLMAASDIAALAAIGMVVAPGALLALMLSAGLGHSTTGPNRHGDPRRLPLGSRFHVQ